MKRGNSKWWGKVLAFFAALGVTAASASAIKTWSSGEVLTASDLNAALAHLHTNLGHGHGAIVVNADISAAAAIAHPKMATPALLPKAWVYAGQAGVACTVSPCTMYAQSGFTSVTRTGAGNYLGTLSIAARPDVNFAAIATSNFAALYCISVPASTTTINVVCYDATGVATDASFSLLVMDNDN